MTVEQFIEAFDNADDEEKRNLISEVCNTGIGVLLPFMRLRKDEVYELIDRSRKHFEHLRTTSENH